MISVTSGYKYLIQCDTGYEFESIIEIINNKFYAYDYNYNEQYIFNIVDIQNKRFNIKEL